MPIATSCLPVIFKHHDCPNGNSECIIEKAAFISALTAARLACFYRARDT